MSSETQNAHASEMYADPPVEPPSSFLSTLARLGPGMIIAGSIVGSGELIATTKVGAEAGFWLLWLIIIGCVIKVFVQVEFGRYTIAHGQTPLTALNSVPGPRVQANWLLWYWAMMTCLIVSQQGGIVGGVGQALAITIPLTEEGRLYNQARGQAIQQQVDRAIASRELTDSEEPSAPDSDATAVAKPKDPYYWAVIVAIATSVLLYFGRYHFIQIFSTVMVVGFTLVTIFTVLMLQNKPEWAITGNELRDGMSFGLPTDGKNIFAGILEAMGLRAGGEGQSLSTSLATALAAFGIIGVGASELIMYPYWCMEKGYAKFTGPRDGSTAWSVRANGWMRVMRIDVWASMVVYTFATVAFYCLGAATLGRVQLNPQKEDMVVTLAQMYVPVFGSWAPIIFLVGAIAVLYSTFFVAAAGNARMVSDGLGIFKVHDGSEKARSRWAKAICIFWPLVAVALFCFVQAPAAMVMWSGVAQALMLPMLGVAALFFRYRRCESSLRPGLFWDLFLWLSFAGLALAGFYSAWSNLAPKLGFN